MLYAHAPAWALERVVALRVSLDDSTPTNGPLRVLPDTHRDGVLTGDQIARLAATTTPVECVVPSDGADRLNILCDDIVDRYVDFAGDYYEIEVDRTAVTHVVAMRPLTIHSSSKSIDDRPRRVLHIEYASAAVLRQGVELAVA